MALSPWPLNSITQAISAIRRNMQQEMRGLSKEDATVVFEVIKGYCEKKIVQIETKKEVDHENCHLLSNPGPD